MASQDRRNPYVILGVPFGASGEEARTGFARVSRRLRNEGGGPYTQVDLTWALHQVEQMITNPDLAIDVYRVPASTSATGVDHEGVFHPAPHPIPRYTTPSRDEWETTRLNALSAALRRIMSERLLEVTDTVPYE